jgi:hypothetical protein
MKKILLTIFILGTSLSSLMAQHDVKINALGLFFRNYSAGYEYIINDEISAGISTNFAKGSWLLQAMNGIDGSSTTYSGFSITPEFRYYTNPDFGADKRYFGAYLIYEGVSWGDLTVYDYDNSNTITYDMSNTGIGIGIIGGQKWVTNSGIYFESLLGFGRFMSSNITISDTRANEIINLAEYDFISGWDLRFQIGIGYRIGGY